MGLSRLSTYSTGQRVQTESFLVTGGSAGLCGFISSAEFQCFLCVVSRRNSYTVQAPAGGHGCIAYAHAFFYAKMCDIDEEMLVQCNVR